MTIAGINIDISGPDATLGEKFDIYIKLLGAYYLALLSDLEPSLFIKTNGTPVEIAISTKEFHRNKLNNLLLMDFMEKDQGGDGRYLPYPPVNKLQNLVFCHKLLESVKNHKQALKTPNPANPANPAFNHIMINYIFHKALLSSETVASALSGASGGAENNPGAGANPVFDLDPPIEEIPQIPAVTAYALNAKLREFVGDAIYTHGQPAPLPDGPNILRDISDYTLPDVANPDACASIKAQLYRVIIADYRYLLALRTENRIDVGGGPNPEAGSIGELNTVLVHSLFQVKYIDILGVNIDSDNIIRDFEAAYVSHASEVSSKVFVIATGVVDGAVVGDVAGGPNAVDMAQHAAAVAATAIAGQPLPDAPAGNPANNIFKNIPYTILSNYITTNGAIIPPVTPNPPNPPTTVVEVFATYYNSLLPDINRSRVIIVNALNPQNIGKGLFAPNIPDVP